MTWRLNLFLCQSGFLPRFRMASRIDPEHVNYETSQNELIGFANNNYLTSFRGGFWRGEILLAFLPQLPLTDRPG